MKEYQSKDGNMALAKDQKYYLRRNGVIHFDWSGDMAQCGVRKNQHEAQGETVEFIPVEEANRYQ